MIDPILAAIDYASGEAHEGAGFTLMLHLVSGKAFEVDVYPGNKPTDYRLQRRELKDKADGNPFFPHLPAIAAVEVLW
jgi:hypothetical protein